MIEDTDREYRLVERNRTITAILYYSTYHTAYYTILLSIYYTTTILQTVPASEPLPGLSLPPITPSPLSLRLTRFSRLRGPPCQLPDGSPYHHTTIHHQRYYPYHGFSHPEFFSRCLRQSPPWRPTGTLYSLCITQLASRHRACSQPSRIPWSACAYGYLMLEC